ncbi:MAG TPA: AAA family ATPase, partial [Actinomycetota bacterium]
MITRVLLENWRAYQHLELTLKPGTTFVVARNGIGKSSLLEAVTFALFGDAIRPPSDAVRLGSKLASATVDVKLPSGSTLTITRQLPKRLPKSRQAPVTATLDGRELLSSELESTVREIFGADSAFLGRVTMLRREDLEAEASELNLQDHLARFFGIDTLRQTLEELRTRKRRIEGEVQDIKDTVAIPPSRLKELRRLHEQAAALTEQAEVTLNQAQAGADVAAEAVQKAKAFLLWEEAQEQRLKELASLAQDVSSATEGVVPLEKLSEALTKAETEIDEQLDAVRRQRGALEGRIAAIVAAREQLDVGVGLCPVCRRPLSPDDLDHAVSAHEEELEQLRAELANLGEAEILDRRNVVQAGLRRLSKLSVVEEQ